MDALCDPAEPGAVGRLLDFALAAEEHAGVTRVETWGTERPPWWRHALLELGLQPRVEPNGLGMVQVPFLVDPGVAMRDTLYYTMGDSDLF